MNTLYVKGDLSRKEQDRIISEMKEAINICTPLDIYYGMEDEVWGIWYEINGTRYLVDPIELVSSIFKDGAYQILERHNAEEGRFITVRIHQDDYYFVWSFGGGITEDGKPRYFNLEEYAGRIRKCIASLHADWSLGKRVAYESDTCTTLDAVGIGLRQMNVSATMPQYYQMTADQVMEEQFVFQPRTVMSDENYTIGIGDRTFDTWLTHWDNNYDRIRHQLESFVYDRKTEIKLGFDLSDTVLKIEHVSILETSIRTTDGYSFTYKDYALVEIEQNGFVHGPILKGYCSLNTAIRTLYEGLLRLAINHSDESHDKDIPTRIEAYNMFKSPVIERYLTDCRTGLTIAEQRQVHVKDIVIFSPDYDVVLTDAFGLPLGIDSEDAAIDGLYDKKGKPLKIPGLVEWQKKIKEVVVSASMGKPVDFDWTDYHRKGMQLARQLRDKLSPDFDLWYCAPFEDNSGTIKGPTLIYDNGDPK